MSWEGPHHRPLIGIGLFCSNAEGESEIHMSRSSEPRAGMG